LKGQFWTRLAQRVPRHLNSGERLYLTGGGGRSLYLVQSGMIKTSLTSPGGQELTLRICKPGEIVGELSLCGGGYRDQASALGPSQVVEIPIGALVSQLQSDPDAALALASLICERLAEAYDEIQRLALDSVLARLVRALLKLSADFGEPASSGRLIPHHITQEELAKMVAARREVVSGLLNRLRESSLIRYAHRGPILVSREALEEFLASLGER
jgi:CRP/FNR family transcriptional regulator, cyclic AMP receptor protein